MGQNEVVPLCNLSLEPSTNKLARAEAHLEALLLKSTEASDKEAFELMIGQPDEERWITVTLAAKELGIPQLALIAGDFIQNLRAALDYVVSAAVDTVPGLPLTIRHQFPICTSDTAFRDKVATDTDRPKVNGPLSGLPREIVGLIRQLQPFNMAGCSPLETIQTLSNADKHRSLLTCAAYPVGSANWTAGPTSEIEANEVIATAPPIPGAPVDIARIRLRQGSTQPVQVTLGTPGQVAVAAPRFNNHAGIVLPIPETPTLLNEVRQTVGQFANLGS